MELDDLMKKYGSQADSSTKTNQPCQHTAAKPSLKDTAKPNRITDESARPSSVDRQQKSSGESHSGRAWGGNGSFGSNNNIHTDSSSSDEEELFRPRSRGFNSGRISSLPSLDIIFIVLIIAEFIILIFNVDAIFYAMLPLISNLFVVLVVGGVLFLIIYLFIKSRRRRF